MSAKMPSQSGASTKPIISEQLLTPKQAAAFLNLSTSWLAKQRLTGGGPPYIKMGGAVRYSASVLQEWMRGKQRLSTSGR
jgi:predicted DNA-binding transcriptional regulator AlpA